jgi:hypothetical protein
LDIGTLAVRESVFEGKFQAPKTVKAMRTIPLGSHAVAVLSSHRDASFRRQPNDLVFGNRKGEAFRESKMLTRVLQPAAEAAGLGRVTWRQFRHIHSSLLNDLRVPGEDRAGAARTREHFDDAGHLHAHRGRVASRRRDRRRGAIVRRIAPKCSEVSGRARNGRACN